MTRVVVGTSSWTDPGFVEDWYPAGLAAGERLDHVYSEKELREIAGRAERLGEEAEEVRVMFNNNKSDYAPRAAEELRELLGQTAHA